MGVSGGDMRRAITTLQSCYRLKGSNLQITKEDIEDISGVVPDSYLHDFLAACKSGSYRQLEDFVDLYLYEAYSTNLFFEQMNQFIVFNDGLADQQKVKILGKLGECVFRLEAGGSEFIQLLDFGCHVIGTFFEN